MDVLTEIGDSSAVSVLAIHGELTRTRSLDANIDSAAFAKAGSDVGVKVESGKDGDKTTFTFPRKLGGSVVEGRSVPFGIAIHASRAAGEVQAQKL